MHNTYKLYITEDHKSSQSAAIPIFQPNSTSYHCIHYNFKNQCFFQLSINYTLRQSGRKNKCYNITLQKPKTTSYAYYYFCLNLVL